MMGKDRSKTSLRSLQLPQTSQAFSMPTPSISLREGFTWSIQSILLGHGR